MSKLINNETIEKKRAVSLDLARGTMLLLIVLAHAPLYLYAADPGIMHRVESGSFFDQIVNLFGIFIIDNRARAMFAVLLGYGLVLAFEGQISKGKNENHAVKIVRKRSWYLILFGIVLAVLIGGQDILMAYGLAGLLVSPLLKCKMKTLIRTFMIITILYIIFIPIIWGFNMQAIGDYGFSPDVSAKDTYLSTTMLRLLFFPAIPVLIHFMFPILPSVILGLWIARYQLLIKPEQHLKKLYFITIIGLAISLIGALPLSFIGTIWYPSVFIAGMINGIHILTGIAGGLAYATGFGIIGSRLKNPGYFSLSLIALGKRSLTFFVLNEALLVILLSPVAFDLGGHVSNALAALIAISIWILSVLLAAIMEKNNLNGPLEILLRRLVYKNKKIERRPRY
ncbi:DUF418 domain-containing protein [Bacillus sp. CH126_4D]|uniref:DUF418 domain-containing protein n=1 Tax=unclassified Bacillus (in: firmicutes) TaxID=185979 RepID=UPI00124C34D6|nr:MULTISPECIES: DUF418 domain-containing protein [unclassified Bacillus (in: firmicutes)]KAB2460008.1 DUF418 domain-containing protein [Bacillus sp. CH140a_4T]KAB2469106.1 DUF418 domain-containing protein [Bacillus sp. CH126_4D]